MRHESQGLLNKKDYLLSCIKKRFLLERLRGDFDTPPGALIISAHPDDEIIGAGALTGRLREQAPVFIEVTDGAPRDLEDARAHGFRGRQGYARARREELLTALKAAGIISPSLVELGVPDKEASFHLAGTAKRIFSLIKEIRPEIILTMPYEGGHPDHDATAFAVHAARKLLEKEFIEAPPIIEYASYHAGPEGGMHFDFLKREECYSVERHLSPEEAAFKKRLAACFRTQEKALAPFPLDIERFREAPLYDFTRPPHEGTLYYENYNWGVKGAKWRELAKKALKELRLRGPI